MRRFERLLAWRLRPTLSSVLIWPKKPIFSIKGKIARKGGGGRSKVAAYSNCRCFLALITLITSKYFASYIMQHIFVITLVIFASFLFLPCAGADSGCNVYTGCPLTAWQTTWSVYPVHFLPPCCHALFLSSLLPFQWWSICSILLLFRVWPRLTFSHHHLFFVL